jgi:competence protein ComEC
VSRLLRARPQLLVACLCVGLAGANLRRGSGLAVVLAAVVVVAASVALPGRWRIPALGVALALGGWWWGSVRLDRLDRSTLLPRVGTAERALVAVTGPARRSPFDVRVPAQMRRFGDQDIREPVLLRLPPGRSPPQGAILDLIGEIRLPRGPKNGFDERTWLRRHGVHVVVRADQWRIVGRRGGLAGFADRLRAQLSAGMAPGLRGERRAMIAGIVLGEDEGLSEDLRADFRASGLYHLLAVSGQNVALIAGGAILLVYLIGLSRFVGQLAALGAIGGYVLAVGWQPSVVRAGVAGVLASLAWLASRPSDRWYFLVLGAALLLAWSPYSLLDAGFQLSFAAVAAIFVVVPRLQQTFAGYPVPHSLAEVVAVSGACGIATAPILLTQFGVVPLYSIPANALAAPVVAPLLGIALVTAIVAPVAPPVAAALAWLNGWLAAYLATCARVVGGLPYAAVSAHVAVVIAAVALGAAYLATQLHRPRQRAYAIAALGVALIAGGWRLHANASALPPPRGLRITFLDVGQGDGALIQVPGGAVLVDEGPPEARVASQLQHLGVKGLSLLVLTHPQRDHVGGAEQVLKKLSVGAVLDPAIPSESPDERAARAAARERGVKILVARAGEGFTIGRLKVRVLWPDGPGLSGDDPNNHAIVLVASYGQTDALFTADAESDVTGHLQLPPVEILKVAHHGSADPGLGDELKALRPRIAVISVGAGNDYGHPTPATLATLGAAPGLAVYRTDLNGRVVVESDGRSISVRTSR